jgi:hypothetical protein
MIPVVVFHERSIVFFSSPVATYGHVLLVIPNYHSEVQPDDAPSSNKCRIHKFNSSVHTWRECQTEHIHKEDYLQSPSSSIYVFFFFLCLWKIATWEINSSVPAVTRGVNYLFLLMVNDPWSVAAIFFITMAKFTTASSYTWLLEHPLCVTSRRYTNVRRWE